MMIAYTIRNMQKNLIFSFAQLKPFKPHLKKYFQSNTQLVQKQMNLLTKKYSINKKTALKLFKLKPQIFIPGSAQRAQIESKIMFLNKLQQKQPMAGVVNELLFDSRNLIMSMNEQQIQNFIQTTKQMGLDDKKTEKLLNKIPSIIHNKFDIVYNDKLAILTDYLHLTKEQALEIFLHQPFLLKCSTNTLRQSICYFVERRNQVLTLQKIVQLLRKFGEIFLIGRQQLNSLVQWYHSWGIDKKELWGILLEHPLLLLNHPSEIFHFKAKMFRQFRFTQEMGQAILRKYPSILICSVRSLESKFLTARDRLKINLNINNLEYLSFKFMTNIRPRAEILIRAKIPYTSEDIVDYLACSQQQFLTKTLVPRQKYEEQKEKYRFTSELDIPRKKCLKNYPSAAKIFRYSMKYYKRQDLNLKKRNQSRQRKQRKFKQQK